MSGPTGWQAPSGAVPPPPRYGEYLPGSLPGAPPSWTPPPKPGLIPLRPLGFGQLLGVPFQVLRRNPKATFGASLLIQSAVVLGALLLTGGVTALVLGRVAMASDADRATISAGAVAAIAIAALVSAALSVIGAALLQGIIVLEVAHGALGQTLRGRELWRGTRGVRRALVGYVLLLAAALAVGIGAVGSVVAVLAVAGHGLVPLAILIGVVGGLGLAVLAVWLGTRLALVPSALVLERVGLRRGIVRSWTLTNGAFWRTLGAEFIVNAICAVAGQIIQTPATLLYGFAIAFIMPAGDTSTPSGLGVGLAIGSYALVLLVTLVVGSITQVVTASVGALLYLDQRMRREGLDLVLTRYVEQRQAGQAVGDPFQTVPQPAAWSSRVPANGPTPPPFPGA